MISSKAFTIRAKQYLKEKGYKYSKLSELSGVPTSTLNNIFRGHTKNIGLLNVSKICEGLGVSMQEFFSDELFSSENIDNY
ncbi:MAG: helix-turn-helix transcriptional regulator [Clostridia bacterium]|nr:helix-turn-helix transcriptional regulator [Clostridia bacterium]